MIGFEERRGLVTGFSSDGYVQLDVVPISDLDRKFKIKKKTVVVPNSYGLCARPSSELCSIALSFDCSIFIYSSDKKADAKSIMSILMLAASKGAELIVEVSGPDEEVNIKAIEGVTDFIEKLPKSSKGLRHMDH